MQFGEKYRQAPVHLSSVCPLRALSLEVYALRERQMASGEGYLWELLKEIEPSRSKKEGAQRSHAFFRDLLRTGQFADRVVDDYLSGSYPRETAIQPLEDVDIVFVID